jgi:hypothetical protein
MNKQITTSLVMLLCLVPYGISQDAEARKIKNRLYNQEQRIEEGQNHHKMNAAQVEAADDKEYKIEAQETHMRNRHKGRLTRADRRTLNRKLNNNSSEIYNDKN